MAGGTLVTMKRGPKPKDPMSRFLPKVSGMDNPEACWEWIGSKNKQGAGKLYISPGKYMEAHRWYYQQTVNPNLENIDLHRICENWGCVNPAHIEEREHPDTEEGRFLIKVDFSGECWEWTSNLHSDEYPYGLFNVLRNGRWSIMRAHRWAWNKYITELKSFEQLDHLCFNCRCVNLDHLRVVTNKQNAEHLRGPGKRNTSGYLGVSYDKSRDKWIARVKHLDKNYYCGRFRTAAEANEAAILGRKQLFTHNNRDYEDWEF